MKVSENPNQAHKKEFESLINKQTLSENDVNEEDLMAACEDYDAPLDSKISHLPL